MGRHGSKFQSIKQIIFHISANQVIVYDLTKDGKHKSNMKRATRTIYKKKDNIVQNNHEALLLASETNNSSINAQNEIISNSRIGEQHFLNLALETPFDMGQTTNDENESEFSHYVNEQTDSDLFEMVDVFFS